MSPSANSMEESHNTLKFALRARNVEVNAKKNEVEDDRALLRRYKIELTSLKEQLAQVNKKLEALQSESVESSQSIELQKLKEENQQVFLFLNLILIIFKLDNK